MRYSIAFAAAVLMAGLTLAFDATAKSEGIVAKPSAFSVKITLDRLEAVFKSKGIRIFARIDHAAAAKSIGKELQPSELLIFGTPKIGTPLMQDSILSGIDLPLKALAYEDAKGQVFLVYNHPGYLARRHEIKSKNKLISSISRILSNLTDQAVKDK
jgi:uncharacterized protein (DUF302 family)